MNLVNANPGNPGALTGPGFDTGIANIGSIGNVFYTIGYNTPILNGIGDDLAIVSARYSASDTFTLQVSSDGFTFTPFAAFGPGLAVATGVRQLFFVAGTGPQPALLFVTPIDLSLFGIAQGATISAVRITSSPEGDLIRVAGLGSSTVPEPNTLFMFSSGLLLEMKKIRDQIQQNKRWLTRYRNVLNEIRDHLHSGLADRRV